MSAWWAYFWPLFALALVAGGAAGLAAFRRRAPLSRAIGIGLAIVAAAIALWHWPLGGADRFSGQVERNARATLVEWEMGAVTARLQRHPLTRRLDLAGPADDFQRTGLIKIMSAVPGVERATWTGERGIPLLAEAAGIALLGFLLGLLLAYLVELRRRYNAQWNW